MQINHSSAAPTFGNLISVTVDGEGDSHQRLRAFKEKIKANPPQDMVFVPSGNPFGPETWLYILTGDEFKVAKKLLTSPQEKVTQWGQAVRSFLTPSRKNSQPSNPAPPQAIEAFPPKRTPDQEKRGFAVLGYANRLNSSEKQKEDSYTTLSLEEAEEQLAEGVFL